MNIKIEESTQVEIYEGEELLATCAFSKFIEANDFTEEECERILKYLEQHGCYKGGGGAFGEYCVSVVR